MALQKTTLVRLDDLFYTVPGTNNICKEGNQFKYKYYIVSKDHELFFFKDIREDLILEQKDILYTDESIVKKLLCTGYNIRDKESAKIDYLNGVIRLYYYYKTNDWYNDTIENHVDTSIDYCFNNYKYAKAIYNLFLLNVNRIPVNNGWVLNRGRRQHKKIIKAMMDGIDGVYPDNKRDDPLYNVKCLTTFLLRYGFNKSAAEQRQIELMQSSKSYKGVISRSIIFSGFIEIKKIHNGELGEKSKLYNKNSITNVILTLGIITRDRSREELSNFIKDNKDTIFKELDDLTNVLSEIKSLKPRMKLSRMVLLDCGLLQVEYIVVTPRVKVNTEDSKFAKDS